MGFGILRIGIMNVIGGYKPDTGLPGHFYQLLVHKGLIRQSVILKLKKIIVLPENLPVLQCRLFRFIIQALDDISLYLSGQAGAQSDDPGMIFTQQLLVHTGPVIIPVHKSPGHDLRQIGIAFIVLGQKHEMIVPVFPACHLTVKPGVRGHIDLTAQDRIDALPPCLSVKIDHAVHDAVIRDRRAVHSQLFHPGHIFFYFIGPVQQTVLCMDM